MFRKMIIIIFCVFVFVGNKLRQNMNEFSHILGVAIDNRD